MEEKLEPDDGINNGISDNTNKTNPKEISGTRSENVLNSAENNVNSGKNSAPNVKAAISGEIPL